MLAALVSCQVVLLSIFLGALIFWAIMSHFRVEWRGRKWLTTFWSLVMCGMIVCVGGEFAVSAAAMIIYSGVFLVVIVFHLGDRIEHIKMNDIELYLKDNNRFGPPGYDRRQKPRDEE